MIMKELVSFDARLNSLCAERGVTPEQVIQKARLDTAYGKQILDGTRKPSRDDVLRLAYGLSLNLDETQALLKETRLTPLYARNERDFQIILALEQSLDVTEML